MLNRIVLINSELYSKADILIGDANSIQLEADSNVGKSSLINTLNFLYIIDQSQMLFEGDRKLKESIKHYFKSVNQSFVVFEINKSGYTYCIIVKANANFELEYYKFNSSYKEEFFFESVKNGFTPRSFENIITTLILETDSKPEQLRPDELYDIVYSKKADKNPVVWLTDKISRTGKSYSNSFTKIYRSLLKSSDIDEQKFKESLLIAANVNEETLPVFANNTNRKIDELRKTELEVKNLKAILEEFKILKKLNDNFNGITKYCADLKNTFIQQFNQETKIISVQLDNGGELKLGIRAIQNKINETLDLQRIKFSQDETKYKTLGDGEEINLTKVNAEIILIDEFKKGSLSYSGLLHDLETLKEQNVVLFSELQRVKREKITKSQLENDIEKIQRQVGQLEKKEKGFNKILGQNISDNVEIKRRLNSILSSNILELNVDDTDFKKVTKTADVFKIFDGEINVQKITIEPIETIDEVRLELVEKKKLLDAKLKTLEFVTETIQKEIDQKRVEKILGEKQLLFEQIENRDKIIENKERIVALINDYKAKELEAKGNALETQKQIIKESAGLKKLENKVTEFEERERILKSNFDRLKEFELPLSEKILDKNINEAFDELLSQIVEQNKIEKSRLTLFVSVNKDLKIDEKDIDLFIETVQKKIENISDLDMIYKDLLQLVYTEFTKPTSDFLDKYKHFQRFITEYNKELEDYPVSNISKLSIMASDVEKEVLTLTKISKLDQKADLFSSSAEHQESIKALEEKIRENKEIKFGDLFELKISIEIDGVKKPPIDLGKQVESRATDRVLKLLLFLSIIRRLVHNAEDNKIVLYIDELGEIGPHNVRQIMNYCIKHNFIPIFAAPRQVEGIEKYYVIKKSAKKQPLKVDSSNVKTVRYKNATSTIS